MRLLLIMGLLLSCSIGYSQQTYYDVTAGNGYGIRLWQSDNYKIHMGNSAEYLYGPVTDYSIKMNSNGSPGRGWTWGNAEAAPIAALNNTGHMQIAGSFTAGGHIYLPSVSGNKSIYTWNSGDDNWRIGTSASPGFTRSLATSHVQYLTYSTAAGQGIAFGVNGGESSFEIAGSNHQAYFRGNVGIGTPSPGGKLEINHAGGQIKLSGGTVAAGLYTSNTDLLHLSDWNTGNNGLTINMTTGNVGVGTKSPNEKLTVNGTVYSKEVKVDLSVPAPDYVFTDFYRLLSLEEVEAYIEVNSHLPEVPSAQEMEENGINVGEMNMILLKKVEELTLYVIELKKENAVLRDDMLKKIQALESTQK